MKVGKAPANRGYAASTLRWWAYRLGRGAAAASELAKVATSTPPKVELVRVTRAPKDEPGLERLCATSMVEVETLRVRVAPGFDEAALRSVIAALRGAR